MGRRRSLHRSSTSSGRSSGRPGEALRRDERAAHGAASIYGLICPERHLQTAVFVPALTGEARAPAHGPIWEISWTADIG
jgi:hypothetical protein